METEEKRKDHITVIQKMADCISFIFTYKDKVMTPFVLSFLLEGKEKRKDKKTVVQKMADCDSLILPFV